MIFILFLVCAGLWQRPSWAGEALQFKLEPVRVEISAAFAGAQVTASGSMPESGDLVLKVAGPLQDVGLTRKTRLGPFWVAGETVKVRGAASLLFVYATAPVATLLPAAEQQKYGLRLEGAALHIEPQAQAPDDWRGAFFRLKQQAGYYREHQGALKLRDNGQFSAHIQLPGDLETGTYTVEALMVNSGKVVAQARGEFKVQVVGMEYWIWNAVHDTPWLFGVLFTLAAMLLGVALSAIPHRSR
jgi:uncharacterized protein (TIGR02186 family)